MKLGPIFAGLLTGVLILGGIWYAGRTEPLPKKPAEPAPAVEPSPEPVKPKPARTARRHPEARAGVETAASRPVIASSPSGAAGGASSPSGVAGGVSSPSAVAGAVSSPSGVAGGASPPSGAPASSAPRDPGRPELRRLESPRPPLASDSEPAPERSSRPVLKRLETPRPPLGSDSGTAPAPVRRAYNGPRSGDLRYSGPPVIQNGEIVFRNLPDTELRLTYDRGSWDARLSPDGDGYQKLVLRSLKPGAQKRCEVRWEIAN